jgi:hypothetical protein
VANLLHRAFRVDELPERAVVVVLQMLIAMRKAASPTPSGGLAVRPRRGGGAYSCPRRLCGSSDPAPDCADHGRGAERDDQRNGQAASAATDRHVGPPAGAGRVVRERAPQAEPAADRTPIGRFDLPPVRRLPRAPTMTSAIDQETSRGESEPTHAPPRTPGARDEAFPPPPAKLPVGRRRPLARVRVGSAGRVGVGLARVGAARSSPRRGPR